MTVYPEKSIAITGIGQSKVGRPSDKTSIELTVDAALQAIADAGLRRADIDGISTWPGNTRDGSGFSPVGCADLQDALRLKVNWYSGGPEAPGQYGAIFNAIAAIHAQLARHVLVFRTVGEATARQTSFANSLQQQTPRQFGAFAGYAPYHVYAAATQQALYFQRYVHESGIREEQIAQIAINGRRNAALNDNAIYRSPISLDDYLASPFISTPLHLYDCDVPVDGSTAIVLSRVEEARDMPNPVIWIEAVGSRMADRNSWTELEDLAGQVAPHPAAMMWNRTDLTPANVDAAQLYDGFSFHTLAWLEAFGFCKRYEAGDFIAGGERIALQGQLPINTSGGQLSAGRLHGYGALHEACAQMWRRCGQRQIQKEVKVTATCTAGGPLGGCMLLVRD